MENYLNILNFCLWKAHYKSHLVAKKINPFNLIHELPFQKRRYKKLGIDIHKEIDKAFADKNFGLSMTVSGGILCGGIAIFFFSILIVFNIHILMPHIIACGVLSGIISYLFVFRNDKYMEYFDKYENWTKRKS